MQEPWITIVEVLKVGGVVFGSFGIVWKVFSGAKAFVDTLDHLKVFMEQAAKDLKEMKGYAFTAVDNHLSHVQESADNIARSQIVANEHMVTMLGELKVMREDFHEHELDDARTQQSIIDTLNAVKVGVDGLKEKL